MKSLFNLLFLFCTAIATSCISVSLKTPETKKADDVEYKAPAKPFISFEVEHIDSAWRNPSNGNSISFLSDCSSKTDPSHEAIRDGIISGIQDAKIMNQKMVDFNQRKALVTQILGFVDGIQTQFEVLILKKNNCIYALTYVGIKDHFPKDLDAFKQFQKEFKAP